MWGKDSGGSSDDKAWIQTFSGIKAHPLRLHPDEVRIDDIAHALSLQNRWTGHTREFYSVAEHSVLVSRVVPVYLGIYGLLHDGSEAYLGDIASPTKRAFAMEGYRMAEHRAELAILEAFGLPGLTYGEQKEIKLADLRVLATEARDLMSPLLPDFRLEENPIDDLRVSCWEPKEAERQFLDRFLELTGL